MWISRAITENGESAPAFTAEVTGAEGNKVSLGGAEGSGTGEAFYPYGIMSVPPKGVKAAAVQSGRSVCVLGCTDGADRDLEPGEIALYSKGGASIILKNDGRVLINGVSV